MIHATVTNSHQHAVLYTFFMAMALVAFSFLLQGNIGLNMADEGALWYGTIRTADGDIPTVDFRSKDPGRYYWTAGWSFIFGEGIMALRLSTAIFQVIGLSLGLLAARRVVKNWCILGLVGLLLLAWMVPRHKLFDSSVAMAAIFMAVRLIEKPDLKRYFYSGLFVGLASILGRNHGLYNFLAFFLLIPFIWIKLKQDRLLKRYGLWLAGIIFGYIPILFMLPLIADLVTPLYHELLYHLTTGFLKTNLSIPIPWPWIVDYGQLDLLTGASKFFIGLFFLLLPLFYIMVITWSFLSRSSDVRSYSLLIGSSFVGLFYMHHFFSRAGLLHLAQGIHPFLLVSVALVYKLNLHHHRGLAVSLTLLILTGTVFAIILPASRYIEEIRAPDRFVQYSIGGDQLWLPKDQATYIETIKQLVAHHVAPDEGLFIAAHSPALYPILHRKAPVYDPWPLLPASREDQEETIEDLMKHKVNWVILSDIALDGRDELRFRNTHPLVWKYIMANFEPIETSILPDNQQFLRRKPPL